MTKILSDYLCHVNIFANQDGTIMVCIEPDGYSVAVAQGSAEAMDEFLKIIKAIKAAEHDEHGSNKMFA